MLIITTIGLIYSDSHGPSGDYTGAPLASGNVGNTCSVSGCHSSASDNGGQVSILVKNKGGSAAVSTFNSNGVYTVQISVTSTLSKLNAGFEATILDPSRAKSGTMSNAGTGSKFRSINSRQFCEHSYVSTTGVWTFDWTAPSSAPDSITIYAAGNATNGDGSKIGDDIKTTKITLKKSASNDLTVFEDSKISIYPNPCQNRLNFSENQEKIEVYDLLGNLNSQFYHCQEISTERLQPGFYFLKLSNGTGFHFQNFQKL